MKAKLMLVLMLSILAGAQAWAADQVPPRPYFVVAFGDSVSHGVWADTEVGKPNLRFYASISYALAMRSMTKAIGAGYEDIHDETAKARYFDWLFGLTKRDRYSALAGSETYAMPSRLKTALGRPVNAKNMALLAATYPSAWVQVADLEKYLKRRPWLGQPDMALINLGAVDFVRKTDPVEFQAGVEQFFARFIHDYPATSLTITDIWPLVSIVTSMNYVTIAKRSMKDKDVSCADMYKQMQIGVKYGIYPGYKGENIVSAQNYLDQLNAVIAAEVKKIAARQSPYAEFRGKVVFVTDLFPPSGEGWKSYLAIDCFHPSKSGQALLAQKMWDALSSAGMDR